MNAAFRKNLTEALAINANDEDTALGTGGAFDGVTGIALSRRTIVTCTWGVSDPRRAGPGGLPAGARPVELNQTVGASVREANSRQTASS